MASMEPNDTLALANFIEFDDSFVELITGEIGDNDVDLFAVELNAGETIFADINAEINGSELNSVLTIFDAAGNLLVQNDDNSFEREGALVREPDPFQQFTAIEGGTYYVGVSSSPNLEYDPNLAGGGVTGDTSGTYSLELRLEEFNADDLADEPNDIIRFANLIELDDSESVVASGVIGDSSFLLVDDDVDLFEVELEAGETLFADIDAERIGSGLDSVLTIFDINGNLLAQNEDNSFELEGELVTEVDPFQAFTAIEDGTYYVGVSSAGNIDYDPNVLVSGTGESSGFYNLVLSFGEEILDDEDDDIDDIDDGILDVGGTNIGVGVGGTNIGVDVGGTNIGVDVRVPNVGVDVGILDDGSILNVGIS